MKIPGLRDSLVKILQDFNLQVTGLTEAVLTSFGCVSPSNVHNFELR